MRGQQRDQQQILLADEVGTIKRISFMGNNYGGDDRIVMVALTDTATAAAEELTTLTTSHNVRYVASDDRTAT